MSKAAFWGVLSCVAASVVLAGEDLSIEATSDFVGKYIWRGQNLNDDPVYQPGISLTKGGLTVGIWGNLDLTNINDRSGDFSELDYYLDWSADFPGLEKVRYSVGVIYYDFPGAGADGSRVPDTVELYWGLSLDTPLNPSVTVYHDLDEAEGTYVNFGLSHAIEKVVELGSDMPVGMEISAGLGWGSGSYNKYYWGIEQSKLNDLAFKVSFPLELAGWTVTPSLNYVTLLNSTIRDTDAYSSDSDYFFAGVGLSKSF